MSKHNLKYLLEHPDEMPTDPKEIERIVNEQLSETQSLGHDVLDVDKIVGKPDENAAPAAAGSSPAEDVAAPAAEAAPVETEAAPETEPPAGIVAKDGKNIIPYSQLENARSRAIAAEKLATELAAQLEIARKAGEQPAEQPDKLTSEDLDALEQESPTLAKTLRSLQDELTRVNGKIAEVVARTNERDEQQASEVKSEIQTAIDDNPTLAQWQVDENQSMWKEAAKFDKILRENPAYDNVAFADRFAKVVELTESALGLQPTTMAPEDNPAPAAPARAAPTLTPQQIRDAAAAKLKQVGATRGAPKSLSDVPGGEPPAQDERQKVESMSPVALGNMFQGFKSAEEIQAYLSTL